MSTELMVDVWNLVLDHADQTVLMCLCDHASDDGTHCYPSIGRIAWKTGYTPRHVNRVIFNLRNQGLVKLLVRGGGSDGEGRGFPNQYEIDLSKGVRKSPFVPRSMLRDAGVLSSNPDIKAEQPRHPSNATMTSNSSNPDPHVRRTISNHHKPLDKPSESHKDFMAVLEELSGIRNLNNNAKDRIRARVEMYPDIDPLATAHDFVDYWSGRRTQSNASWSGKWTNWMKKAEADYGKNGQRSRKLAHNTGESAFETEARRLAERRASRLQT